MPLIYVQDPVHEDALALLGSRSDLVLGFGEDGRPLGSVIADVEGMLVRTRPLDAVTLEAAPRLRVVARHGVGLDNIDVAAATRLGIRVLNTPRSNYRSVAEHVFALLFALRRRTIASDRLVRDGRFAERDTELLLDIGGSTLGILGLGRIGREVARIGKHGFGAEVIGYDPFLDQTAASPENVDVLESDLSQVLRRSDAVTVHVPRTPDTEGLIGRPEFEVMPRHSVLINTSRGGVVDEGALHEALSMGSIAGAGLDVFDLEPPPVAHPLLSLGNVVLSPHSAGLTERAMRNIGTAAAQGLLDLLGGADLDLAGRDWEVVNPPSVPGT